MALSQEAVQSMLDAMKIISSAEMNNISYDTTIICTITDNSHATKESYYMVTDGSVKFKAYVLSTEDTTKYKVDDQVYVKIPCGDYTRQKVIEGYYVADSAEVPSTYVSPLKSFFGMSSLSEDGENGHFAEIDYALIANQSDHSRIPLWQWSIDPLSNSADDLQMNGLYDTLVIQAEFQTLMSHYKMYSGNYGLELQLYVRLHPTSNLHTVKTLRLDSSEMFGNPYAFSIAAAQAKSFNISEIGIVDGMTLWFYQENNFNYYNDKGVVTRLPLSLNPNILVENIYIAMGSNIAKVTDNVVKIYNLEDKAFKYSNPNDSTNQKNIGFIWYNKNKDDDYVGFSDGVVYPDTLPYDELDYLDRAAANNRLLAQQGKAAPNDKNGLEIAANVADAEQVIKDIGSLIQVNLVNTLTSLYQRTKSLTGINGTSSNEYFNGSTGKIPIAKQFVETFNTDATALINWYKEALEAAYAIQVDQINENTPTENKIVTRNTNTVWGSRYTNFKSVYKNNANQYLEHLKNTIESTYTGFQSVYDIWVLELDKIFTQLDDLFEKLKTLLNNKSSLVTSNNQKGSNQDGYMYHIDKTIIPFESADFSPDDNRYCIYWYQYDESCVDDAILEPGWKRIVPGDKVIINSQKETIDMPFNLGLPSKYDEVDGKYYHAKRPDPSEGFLKIYLNPEKKEEKFKVVIFYNHEKYVSDELVFTNADELVDTTTLDANASISIAHGNNSNNTYQTLYNSNNTLTNYADSSIPRMLSVNYEGLLGDNNSLIDAQVFWYIPRNSTMLDVNLAKLTGSYGFTTDYYRTAQVKKGKTAIVYTGPGTQYARAKENGVDLTYAAETVLNKVYDKTGKFYSLKSSNAIGLSGQWVSEDDITIIDNDETYMDGFACFYKTIKMDSDLSKDEVKIVNSNDLTFEYKIKNYYVPTALNNTIFCIVKKLSYVYETSISMTFGTQGLCGTDYTLLVQPSTIQRGVYAGTPLPLSLQLFNYNNEEMQISTSMLSDGGAGSFNVKWVGPSTYIPIIENQDAANTIVNSLSMQHRSDGDNTVELEHSCGIAQIGINITDAKYGGSKDLSVKYPVPYSAGNYYIEGPTSVIYDSSGANPTYYKEQYRLFDGNTNTERSDVTWILKTYMFKDPIVAALNEAISPDFVFQRNTDGTIEISSISGEEISDDIKEEANFYNKYIPVLDAQNKLIPCNMYIGEVHNDNGGVYLLNAYPVVYAYDGTGTLVWAQPIVIDQNRYPNSVANAWDGKFQIDEKNGTIMSTMVGAGYKNIDNTYSGVLMGKIDGATDVNNKTDVGVYGFNHGAQSFGLNIDGTAFFGKSGRGRILIDGNHGTISSASYQQNKIVNNDGTYESDAGMMIDLDDGFIDMQGVSKNGTEYTANKTSETDEDGQVKTAQSHVRIDVCSPYFTIRSAKQFDPNKNIIHIADDEYYLQSDNYIKGTYSLAEGVVLCPEGYLCRKTILQTDGEDTIDSSGNFVYKYNYVNEKGEQLYGADGAELYLIPAYIWTGPNGDISYSEVRNGNGEDGSGFAQRVSGKGQGTKFDLQTGSLDAYNLVLTSKNVYLDSSDKTSGPYFVIRDDHGHNLLYAGSDGYYLKSCSYSDELKSGLKIDLQDGSINGYNFKLQANASTNQYLGSNILIDSGTEVDTGPKIIFHYQENKMQNNELLFDDNNNLLIKQKVDMLHLSTDKFVMYSKDWYTADGPTLYEDKVTVQYWEGRVIANYLTIREEPITSADSTGKIVTDDIVKIYNYGTQNLTNNFFSMQPPIIENGEVKKDAQGNLVFPTGDDGRWVVEFLDDKYYWEFPEDIQPKEEEIIIPKAASGQKIDVGEGKILLQQSSIFALELNSKASTYPLQLGSLGENNLRNFRVGWDGSIRGGSTKEWLIKKDGRAKFSWITCTGGEFSNIKILGSKRNDGTFNTTIGVVGISDATITNALIEEDLLVNGNLTLTLGKHLYFANTATNPGNTGTYIYATSSTSSGTGEEGEFEMLGPDGKPQLSETVVTGIGVAGGIVAGGDIQCSGRFYTNKGIGCSGANNVNYFLNNTYHYGTLTVSTDKLILGTHTIKNAYVGMDQKTLSNTNAYTISGDMVKTILTSSSGKDGYIEIKDVGFLCFSNGKLVSLRTGKPTDYSEMTKTTIGGGSF